MNAWTSIVAATMEAWQELRIHRTRVLLSLIGVAVAVCSLTAVVALSGIAEEANIEQIEANQGQPANISISVTANGETQPSYAELQPAFDQITKRYGIRYASAHGDGTIDAQFVDGVQSIDVTLADPAFAQMHVVSLAQGRWLDNADKILLAPAVVVNETVYQSMGTPALSTHPVIQLLGSPHTVGVVVGVVRGNSDPDYWQMYMLPSAYERVADPANQNQNSPQEELWVPPRIANALTPLVQQDLNQYFDGKYEVDVNRNDYLAHQRGDPLFLVKLVVGGIAVLILLLGALGLFNISMVTVRYRVREIGIRRSFGATAARVFFSVMMESVVATVAAGGIGVIVAILLIENPISQGYIARGVVNVPPFPFSAAVIGIVASTVVGALAGLLPALVAVRVKVIDAIRF
ncbi:MAG TPA: ABC transporter permease [Galbitalea sp.]